jgi:hypothetical protein
MGKASQFGLLVVCLLGMTDAVKVFEHSNTKVESMQEMFFRSEEAHKASMETIMQGMSASKALKVLEKRNMTSPQLLQVANMALGKQSHLRKQPKGSSGIDGARKLLNDMIYESLSKYDTEIAKCTEYYSEQCAAMEACRGQIAASNYIAANSRMLILDAQATINRCEVDIPTLKLELSQHILKCKNEIARMNVRLKIILGDIAIMTIILEMTDCEKKLMQTNKMALLRCEDPCTQKSFVTFGDDNPLKQKVSQLQSSVSHDLMQTTFADLFEGVEGLETMEQSPIINKTKFNNPPVPRTAVPKNPCNDPDAGAPSAADKRAAKCTIKKSPQCYKLQERFLLIQSGIEDERDELMEEIAMFEAYCEATKETLEAEISHCEDMLASAQTDLAAATTKEASAGEEARLTAIEHEQLERDLTKQMKTCSGNYINF